MRKVIVAECEQEISSFNPALSEYSLFDVHHGQALFDAHAGAETCVRGALDVLRARPDLQLVPLYGAKACSAGPLSRAGFQRISGELLDAVKENADGVDGMYFCMHGAMGSEDEVDPEGYLLERTRAILGPDVPIVVSLDLHGVLTARMLHNCDAVVVYHTYPHEDFVDTGQRAAHMLLRLLDGEVEPAMARVFIPALVRGPELITRSGLYGEVIRRAEAMEREDGALAAAVLIGNPFTDAPELGSQALVVTDGDATLAARLAEELAAMFWAHREAMVAPLISLEEAIADASMQSGTVTFTDAADAPSSGASGDSNTVLAGLLEAGYRGSVIMPMVDAPAAAAAHAAGIGARLSLSLGGSVDPVRFPPLALEVEVERLGDGEYVHEVSRLPAHAGPTAVLRHGGIRIVVVSIPVHMMDRAIFLEHGLDPEAADLVVVKSPGAYARYFTFAVRNHVVDIPGATSANLGRLGHRLCPRPMFPLDDDVRFTPRAQLFPSDAGPEG
jgi:microcystin degradation protein MlrC